ncbi:ankyrin repeat domain-containing protein 7-like [Apteryx mantelli]|uniref:Ankyrin repeat domain-containing protein 7-like n=1 Tax=Apteryx mantelli TaxID=2696672 RepID=A0ABM4G6U9_9AVES
MKRLFGLFSKGQGLPPSLSGGASLPCVGAASELWEKELGKLHRAAASGDLARVRRPWWLPRLGINRRDKAKRTPLHLACANGHSEVVSYLVGNKCKLDPRDNFKRSPLMKLRCMALGLRCDEDCKCGAGTQAVLLEMQEESPERKGEEATGGPQVADAAEAPAGVREKATGSGENTAVRLGLNNTALFFLCS